MEDTRSKLRLSTPRRNPERRYQRRHLYVATEDTEIWLRAEEYAKANGVSMSSLAAVALENFLEKIESTNAPES